MRWKAYPATAYPGFHSIKPLEEKLFFLGGMKLYNRVAPLSLYIIVFYRYFISAYLYPWVKEALWEYSLLPKNTQHSDLATSWTQTVWSRLWHSHIHIITLDWLSIDEDFVTGVNGTVAFIGESRGEGDGLDTLKGALHSSLDRSSIKLCCCLWVKNQDLFVTLVNVCLHGYIMFNFICCSR